MFLEMNDLMNPAEKGFPAGGVNACILGVRRNVGDDKYLGVTGLPVKVAARKEERIAIQIVQHIAVFQSATELLEDNDVLAVVGVEGVTVIRDTVAIGVAVSIHDRAGFAGAGFAEDIGHSEVTPGIEELSIPEGGAGPL